MEKVAPNSKFVGHSTEIIQQTKIKGPLCKELFNLQRLTIPHFDCLRDFTSINCPRIC